MNSELQNCQQTEPCTVEEIRNSLEQSEKGSIRVETYLNRWKSRKWQESLRQVIIVYEPCEQYIPYLFGYVSTWSWPKFPQAKLDELYQQWLNDHSNYDILWKTQRSSQTMRNEYMASIFMLALQKKS